MLMLSVMLLWALSASGAPPLARLLDIQGAIGPTAVEDLEQALGRAAADRAAMLILRIDTPGGLDSAMRRMIRAILASSVPVVCYVAPPGARAASAGVYIMYACHVAAMAPATNLGAATPVRIGTLPGLMPAQPPMRHKMVNDAAAYMRALATMRGRNAEWGEQAVRQAASLSARQALENGVIDLIANDLNDLLQQLDGRVVAMPQGDETLHAGGAVIEPIERSWRSRLLAVISNPDVAYILMLLGIYGLFFELANPGFVLPGVVGGISLLLALFAFQLLPVNLAGFGLIALGIAFMVAEAFLPSFGILGLGGVIAFVVGSIMLMDAGGYAISLSLIAALALLSAFFFALVAGMAIRARRRPVVSGAEELLHATGIALESFEHQGRVQVRGETWQAVTHRPVREGEAIRVTGRRGLVLEIAPGAEQQNTEVS